MEKKKKLLLLFALIVFIVVIIGIIIKISNNKKINQIESENLIIQEAENIEKEPVISEGTRFKVSDLECFLGEEVIVEINMLDDASFVAANFDFIFDDNLEYLGYEKGEILENAALAMVNDSVETNKISIGYVGNPNEEVHKVNAGRLLRIKFKIKDNISVDTINPILQCTTLKNSDGEDINVNINQGSIKIVKEGDR